jgi:hypothetical protein
MGGSVSATVYGPVDFTGVTLPFTVPDMLGTALNFLGMYGGWVIMALGVLFSPVLYSLAGNLVDAVTAKLAKGK